MATTTEVPPSGPESFADDLAGMGNFLIDPAGAAGCVFRKWFWVSPFIVVCIISIVVSLMMQPIVRHALEVSPIPANVDPERYQKGIAMSLTIQRFAVFLMPIFVGVVMALQALIVLASGSVLGITAKFRSLFNLVAGCSLISVLASVASVVILKAKGDISSTAELRPPLGLDIFLSEGANRFLTAFLAYFSIFEIWWIVMMVLIFSSAFRVSKGKALAAILPLVILSLLFRIVAAGFQHR